MNLINGLSSLMLFISAFNSIKTQNCLWIFANFYIIYTSFMYNTHKFDLYEKYKDKMIIINDLSDKYDIFLFNDYIAVSLLAFANIDSFILKNFLFSSFFIEYYHNKSIENSNSITFFIAIISRSIKTINTYKKHSINDETVFYGLLHLINACFTLFIRQKYSYTRETQFLNLFLTTIWHFNVVNIFITISSCMYSELIYNKDNTI
uniref:Uncharacterized protein n=1 Tax=viral metagenome TaxID=1070528 RepID=A0A6C0DC40_9ZZZZ